MEGTASSVAYVARSSGNLGFTAFGEVITMRHLVRVTGVIIALTLLLAVVVGSAQVHQAEAGQSEMVPASTDNTEQTEDTALVCLALVGGTALLAGGVWIGKLRRMLS